MLNLQVVKKEAATAAAAAFIIVFSIFIQIQFHFLISNLFSIVGQNLSRYCAIYAKGK